MTILLFVSLTIVLSACSLGILSAIMNPNKELKRRNIRTSTVTAAIGAIGLMPFCLSLTSHPSIAKALIIAGCIFIFFMLISTIVALIVNAIVVTIFNR